MRRRRILAGVTGLSLLLSASGTAASDDSEAFATTAAAAALGAFVCSSVAHGFPSQEEPPEYLRRGWFVRLAGAFALPAYEDLYADEAEKATGSSVDVDIDGSLGLGGGFGYRCHRYLATEVQVEKVVGFRERTSLAAGGEVADALAEPLAVTTNFKLYPPGVSRLQPFALVGGGLIYAGADDRDPIASGVSFTGFETDILLRFGAGLEFYATRHVVLNVGADYLLPIGKIDDLDYISVGWGLQYRF